MNRIPPPDDAAYQDSVLMAEVSRVNTMLGYYVLDFLDADAGRKSPISLAAERDLAERVAALASAFFSRAARREREGEPSTRSQG